MKAKLFIGLLMTVLLSFPHYMSAQNNSNRIGPNRFIQNENKMNKDLRSSAFLGNKDVMKQVRKLKRAGFRVFDGAPELSDQVYSLQIKEAECTPLGETRWCIQSGCAEADNVEAAAGLAVRTAKEMLAEDLLVKLVKQVRRKVKHEVWTKEEGRFLESVADIMAPKLADELISPMTLLKVYRSCDDRRVEVRVTLGCELTEGLHIALQKLEIEAETRLSDLFKEWE